VSSKREKVKGRTVSGPFLQLPKSVINRSECYTLSHRAFKLLFDLYSQYNGRNNGDFCMAWSVMSNRGWKSRETLNEARKDLLKSDFIIVTRVGGRNKPTLYAITFLSIDECKGKLDVKPTNIPSHYWKKERPEIVLA